MSEAIKQGGGQQVASAYLGSGATHVVCQPQAAGDWLSMGRHMRDLSVHCNPLFCYSHSVAALQQCSVPTDYNLFGSCCNEHLSMLILAASCVQNHNMHSQELCKCCRLYAAMCLHRNQHTSARLVMQQHELCDMIGNWVSSQCSLDKRVSKSTQLQRA